MYMRGELPEQAKIETSNYKPMLWTKRAQRNRRANRELEGNQIQNNNNNNGDGDGEEGDGRD